MSPLPGVLRPTEACAVYSSCCKCWRRKFPGIWPPAPRPRLRRGKLVRSSRAPGFNRQTSPADRRYAVGCTVVAEPIYDLPTYFCMSPPALHTPLRGTLKANGWKLQLANGSAATGQPAVKAEAPATATAGAIPPANQLEAAKPVTGAGLGLLAVDHAAAVAREVGIARVPPQPPSDPGSAPAATAVCSTFSLGFCFPSSNTMVIVLS